MTELEWLQSEDPEKMLCWVTDGRVLMPLRATKRKLLLLACALRHNTSLTWDYGDGIYEGTWKEVEDDLFLGKEVNLPGNPESFVRLFLGPLHSTKHGPSATVAASCFRDIIGNPFRQPPVIQAGTPLVEDGFRVRVARPGEIAHCVALESPRENGLVMAQSLTEPRDPILLDVSGMRPPPPPWRTPQVLALANAAYSERREDGTLDADRLAILADCLEENGCADEDLLRHLRGYAVCSRCFGKKKIIDSGGERGEVMEYVACWRCDGLGWEKPDEGAAHYRGCWALDTVLGKD